MSNPTVVYRGFAFFNEQGVLIDETGHANLTQADLRITQAMKALQYRWAFGIEKKDLRSASGVKRKCCIVYPNGESREVYVGERPIDAPTSDGTWITFEQICEHSSLPVKHAPAMTFPWKTTQVECRQNGFASLEIFVAWMKSLCEKNKDCTIYVLSARDHELPPNEQKFFLRAVVVRD